MIVNDSPLSGLKIVQRALFGDNRGFFSELFNARDFAHAGLPTEFSQDNHSRSLPGTLRGLHFQRTPAQGKLVGIMRGKIWDVAVDIRSDSPTFGQYHAEELSVENGKMLWIPHGFAHGFCVLGDEPADILYKVTGLYNKESEGGIHYNDPALNIAWNMLSPILSERDDALPSWSDYCGNPIGSAT